MRFGELPFVRLATIALIATMGVDLVRIWPSAEAVNPDFALRRGFNYLFLHDFDQLGEVFFPHGPLAFLQYPSPALFRAAYLFHWFLLFILSWLILDTSRRANLPFALGMLVTLAIVVLSKLQIELVLLAILLSWRSLQEKEFEFKFWLFWFSLSLVLSLSFYIRSMPFVLGLAVWGGTLVILGEATLRARNIKKVALTCMAALVFPMLVASSWSILWGWPSFTAYLQAYYHLLVGSSSATALYPPNPVYVFIAFGGFLLLFWRYSSLPNRFKGIIILVSLLLFKYSFGREDPGHLYFILIAFAILALVLLLEEINRKKSTLALMTIGTLSIFWLGITQAGGTDKLPFPDWRPFTNLQYFIKPAVAQGHSQASKDALDHLYELPAAWRHRMDSSTVDFFPWDMGFLGQSPDINYAPAPVLQSYAAYTPYLDSLNAEHFTSAEYAPGYIVWHGSPRNGKGAGDRILKQNILNVAPQTIRALLKNYAPVDTTHQLSFWKRRKKSGGQGEQKPLLSINNIGEWITLPKGIPSDAQGKINLKLSLLGRLANLFYKAPPLWIDYKLVNGEVISYRLNMQNGQRTFYLHPGVFSYKCGFTQFQDKTLSVRLRSRWTWGMIDF